jgi:hypothetical protein
MTSFNEFLDATERARKIVRYEIEIKFENWLKQQKKPRIRVKAISRYLGKGVPDDAKPGDLMVWLGGGAVRVYQVEGSGGWLGLGKAYAGNYFDGVRPDKGCKLYNYS